MLIRAQSPSATLSLENLTRSTSKRIGLSCLTPLHLELESAMYLRLYT